MEECVSCKKDFPENQLKHVLDEDGEATGDYCPGCLADGIAAGWIFPESETGK